MKLTYNLSQVDLAVKCILENSSSKTLLFYGEMGAGKTTLIKALVAALGVKHIASSPTFSLVNEYHTDHGSIFHFDFYRIKDESEALDMGIEEYLDSDSWKLIEWPQNIKNLVGNDGQKLEIEVIDEGTRTLKFC